MTYMRINEHFGLWIWSPTLYPHESTFIRIHNPYQSVIFPHRPSSSTNAVRARAWDRSAEGTQGPGASVLGLGFAASCR